MLSARFDKQVEVDQVLVESDFLINLNSIQKSDIYWIDVRSQLEQQIKK